MIILTQNTFVNDAITTQDDRYIDKCAPDINISSQIRNSSRMPEFKV